MVKRLFFLPGLAALLLGACSDDSGGGGPDAGESPDANPACADPTSALASPWASVDAVSTGAVVDTGNTATVDATAGGSPNAADNPYIYLKLSADSVTKVEITDVDSYQSDDWDLALKRYVLRVNGGDSGPGGVEVATVVAETLAEVTEVPADSEFATDDWVTDDCQLVPGPLGEPATALSDWYGYDESTNQLTPKGEIYVLRRPDGSAIKLDIQTFYHDDVSGHYEIEWGAL